MTIKVVRGLAGQAKTGSSSTSNYQNGNSGAAARQATQVVASGTAVQTDAAVSTLRQARPGGEATKLRDAKDAKSLAKSVADRILDEHEAAESAHELRPTSGQTAL